MESITVAPPGANRRISEIDLGPIPIVDLAHVNLCHSKIVAGIRVISHDCWDPKCKYNDLQPIAAVRP